VLSTIVLILFAGCSSGGDDEVETGVVGRDDVTEVVEAPGVVTAKASATLTASADGRIGVLLVTDGQQVDAGAMLMQIDSTQAVEDLRLAQEADAQAAASAQVSLPGIPVSRAAAQSDAQAAAAFAAARTAAEQIPEPTARAQALSTMAAAQAQYTAARADADRAIRRLNVGLGSLADAVGALAQAQRIQTRAAVEAAQRTVDGLEIRTPVAGIVTLASAGGSGGGGGLDLSQLPSSLAGAAESALGGSASGQGGGAPSGPVASLATGSPVTSGQTVATVTDVSTLSLAAEVDETDVLLVQPGVSGTAELDALPGASYDVAVSSVDVSPVATTGGGVTYRVRLALGPGTDREGGTAPTPRPGMSAVVDLRVREVNDALAVPAAAVVRDGARDSVWLVVDDVARRQYVTLGAQGESELEIVTGLQQGERIVVRGADRVRDGQDLSS